MTDIQTSSKEQMRCRNCQFYGGADHRCSLLDAETRGSFVCGSWMPLYRTQLDEWKGLDLLKKRTA